MKRITNSLFIRLSSLISFLSCFFYLGYFKIQSLFRTSNQSRAVIAYIPKRASGWILEYLYKDISGYATTANFLIAYDVKSLLKAISLYDNYLIFSLHQKYLPFLTYFVPCEKIICLYTHTKLKETFKPRLHNSLMKTLVFNGSELNQAYTSGVHLNKLSVFPVGIDLGLFNWIRTAQCNYRPYDFIFSCKYEPESNLHYNRRKDYKKLTLLANKLSSLGYSVTILGQNWSNSGLNLASSINLITTSYDNYPSLYAEHKVFISVSLLEGGPISFLEAMASGCSILTTPTGFVLDYDLDDSSVKTLPSASVIDHWVSSAVTLLECSSNCIESNICIRRSFLAKSDFQHLANRVEALIQ